jgi:hypothetical protein
MSFSYTNVITVDSAATIFWGYFSCNAALCNRGPGLSPDSFSGSSSFVPNLIMISRRVYPSIPVKQFLHPSFLSDCSPELIADSKNLVCTAIRRRAAEKILFSLRLSVMNEKPLGTPRIEDIMTEECLTGGTASLSNRKMTCSFVLKAYYADFMASCSFFVESSPISSARYISSEKHQVITPHPLCR